MLKREYAYKFTHCFISTADSPTNGQSRSATTPAFANGDGVKMKMHTTLHSA